VSTYTVRDAARILKVSPARLRYWRRTELVAPAGTADPEALEFRDLVCVRGILGLLEQGVPLRRIRRTVEALRERLPEMDDPVRTLRVWAEGSPRMVVRHDGVLIEPDGQTVLDFGSDETSPDPVRPIHAEPEPLSAEDAAEECFARGCQLDGDPATYDDAIAAYEQGIALDPDFADCHCNLGAVHYNRGDRDGARRCFERCLRVEPHHVEANFNLANLLEEEGRDAEALRHYKVALAADPLYPDLHINLALLYEKLAVVAQARRHWRRYLQLESGGAWSDVARRRLEKADDQ
jgi:DNA-binding transcriptional MerR regulator